MDGNITIANGQRYDTGRKFIGNDGVVRPIIQKTILAAALPNAALGNFPHGEAIRLVAGSSHAKIVAISAANGTVVKSEGSIGVTVDFTNTNIAITTTTDLSAYTNALITFEFVL